VNPLERTGARKPQRLTDSIDVRAPQDPVRLQETDLGPVVVDGVDLVRQFGVDVIGQPEPRARQVAGQDGETVQIGAHEQPVPFEPGSQPVQPGRRVRRTYEAADPRVGTVEQLAEQERSEEAGRAGEQHVGRCANARRRA
jgi:hypothetical protein